MARMTRVERRTPDTWKAALQDFLFWKQAQGASPRTLKDYRQHVTRITPYMLRHSVAIETLRGGANAFTVQAMLGHSTMNMTKRYVHLVENDLQEQMRRQIPWISFFQTKAEFEDSVSGEIRADKRGCRQAHRLPGKRRSTKPS